MNKKLIAGLDWTLLIILLTGSLFYTNKIFVEKEIVAWAFSY